MKLRNKLIPIIGVAATATTIAPLATSCGNISLSKVEMIDVLDGYAPTAKRAEGSTTMTAEQVLDLYVDHIKKNPEIFAQDIAWWESIAMKYRLYNAVYGRKGSMEKDLKELYGLTPTTQNKWYTTIPQIAKFGVSDLSVNSVKLVNPNTQKEELINTISCKFNYEYQYEITADVAHGVNRYTAKRITTSALTSEYKNIPFTVTWDSSNAIWRVIPLGWFNIPNNNTRWIMEKHENWCFDFNLSSVTTDTISDYNGNVDTFTYDDSQGGKIDDYARLIAWTKDSSLDLESEILRTIFNFGSYHLYDIKGPEYSTNNFGNKDSIGDTIYEEEQTETGLWKYDVKLSNAINLNWSYIEYFAEICPLDPETSKTYSLADDSEELAVYGPDGKAVSGAYAQFEAKGQNLNVVCSNYSNISAQIDLWVSIYLPTKLGDKEDIKNYKFTMPKTTTEHPGLKLSIPYYKEDGETVIQKTKVIEFANSVNCFWVSTENE